MEDISVPKDLDNRNGDLSDLPDTCNNPSTTPGLPSRWTRSTKIRPIIQIRKVSAPKDLDHAMGIYLICPTYAATHPLTTQDYTPDNTGDEGSLKLPTKPPHIKISQILQIIQIMNVFYLKRSR